MQHNIPVAALGPQGPAMAHAIESCVHCGFCLATCPTYKVLGDENESPRGRIVLMKEQLEGNISLESMLPHIDRCLGCMACVTACPSGVEYGHLLAPFRARAARVRARGLVHGSTHIVAHQTLPFAGRFRVAASLGKLGKPLRRLLPAAYSAMLGLVPDSLPAGQPLPALAPALGKRRARVALLTGCVQQVLAPNINAATVRVLQRNGVEVLIPQGQGCCGSLSFHTGEQAQARTLARDLMRLFPRDIDAVIINAAGCGSGVREYPLLFAGEADAALAEELARLAVDVSVFLDRLGLVGEPVLPTPVRAVYHDACHLAHAQKVTAEPRRILRQVGNLTLLEPAEAELCCGSAGTYNIEQPGTAGSLGERKAANLLATGAQAVISGNIGCLTQIRTHLAAAGKRPLPVWHTIEVLDMAYRAAAEGVTPMATESGVVAVAAR
jgi:glycolate oxidase iron-sulfur subunit